MSRKTPPRPSPRLLRLGVVGLTLASALGLVACNSEATLRTAPPWPDVSVPGEKAQANPWKAPAGIHGEIDFWASGSTQLNEALAKRFSEISGVKVNLRDTTTDRIVDDLKEERFGDMDLVYLDDWQAAAQFSELWEKVELDPGRKVREGFSEGPLVARDATIASLLVAYSTLPTVPGDWAHLVDRPEYFGRIVMVDPRRDAMTATLLAGLYEQWGDEKFWEFFDQLSGGQVLIVDSDIQALNDVLSEDRSIALGLPDYEGRMPHPGGSALDTIIPDGGSIISPHALAVAKNSDNPKAAQAFVDFMLSDEGQDIVQRNFSLPALEGWENLYGEPVGVIKQLAADTPREELYAKGQELAEAFAKRYADRLASAKHSTSSSPTSTTESS